MLELSSLVFTTASPYHGDLDIVVASFVTWAKLLYVEPG